MLFRSIIITLFISFSSFAAQPSSSAPSTKEMAREIYFFTEINNALQKNGLFVLSEKEIRIVVKPLKEKTSYPYPKIRKNLVAFLSVLLKKNSKVTPKQFQVSIKGLPSPHQFFVALLPKVIEALNHETRINNFHYKLYSAIFQVTGYTNLKSLNESFQKNGLNVLSESELWNIAEIHDLLETHKIPDEYRFIDLLVRFMAKTLIKNPKSVPKQYQVPVHNVPKHLSTDQQILVTLLPIIAQKIDSKRLTDFSGRLCVAGILHAERVFRSTFYSIKLIEFLTPLHTALQKPGLTALSNEEIAAITNDVITNAYRPSSESTIGEKMWYLEEMKKQCLSRFMYEMFTKNPNIVPKQYQISSKHFPKGDIPYLFTLVPELVQMAQQHLNEGGTLEPEKVRACLRHIREKPNAISLLEQLSKAWKKNGLNVPSEEEIEKILEAWLKKLAFFIKPEAIGWRPPNLTDECFLDFITELFRKNERVLQKLPKQLCIKNPHPLYPYDYDKLLPELVKRIEEDINILRNRSRLRRCMSTIRTPPCDYIND